MPETAGIGAAVDARGAPAGLSDPAFFVPPIAARSTRLFGLAWLLVPLAWAAAWPLVTLLWVNGYEDAQVNFVQGLYERKAVAAARASARAAEATPPRPRLFVVGGSGSLVGIDAELLELKLGVPAVSFAAHAGLGPEYLLARARREIRPGDVVLLSPEYQLWGNPAETFTDLAWGYVTSYDRGFLGEIDRLRALRALYSVPAGDYYVSLIGWRKRLRGRHHHTRPVYDCSSLSPNGDLRFGLPKAPIPRVDGYPFPDVRTAEAAGSIRYFRRFAEWAKSNGVRVLLTWPNMPRPDVPLPPGGDRPPAELTGLLRELEITPLDTPAEVSFPRPWFTDTAYHPDGCCRRLRTDDLARRLRPQFGLPPAPEKPTGYFLVTGGDHRPTRGNAFADDAGVRTKYLVAEPADHPDAVTPAQVATLRASGAPVYFDDPAVGPLLEPLGWRAAEVARTTASLADWTRRYDRHLLLTAGPGATVTVVGTGPWSYVNRTETGRLQIDLRALAARPLPQLLFVLESRPGPSVRVNRRRITGAGESNEPSGAAAANEATGAAEANEPTGAVAAVVIDPEMGTIADAATFPAGGGEVVTWRLYRLVAAAP